MNQDGTLGKKLPVIPIRVNYFLQKHQKNMWYQDEISMAYHRLVGSFQFGATGINKLKYLNMIEEKHWK